MPSRLFCGEPPLANSCLTACAYCRAGGTAPADRVGSPQTTVGNAVPGVPSGKFDLDGQIFPQPHQIAAFGGRNAEDGVPYGQKSKPLLIFLSNVR